MVIGKIRPTATIVAQFAAGVEVEAIQHEGKMFLPIVGMGEFAATEPTPSKPAKKEEPTPSVATEEKSVKSAGKKSYTKDELMETDSKELVKILKNEFGINPDDFDGKNTNKKLRDLILDAQKNGGAVAKEETKEEEENDSPEAEETEETSVVDQIGDILEDFDAGKKNKKKTIAAICDLSEDADSDKVAELVEEFEDDADADIDEMAQKIADSFAPKKSAKKEKGAKSKRGKKEEDLVDVSDLEVGDRVSVWWDDDNQEWFDGEVKSINKKGKVVIAYDDDTEEPIDPEVHTKIKKLAE